MCRIIHPLTIPALLITWLLVSATAYAETITVSRMSTRFLVRGEQALLEISLTGAQPTDYPVIPSVPGVEIRPSGRDPQTQLLPGRRLEYVFEYFISSYETGNHILPAIDLMVGRTKSRTAPLEFTVFNPDELKWSEAVIGNTKFRYASAFRILNPRPYNGEATPVEIKIFVPRDLFFEDWGIPDFQRDGLTAWRFQPSAMRGEVNLLGIPCVSVAYPSTLTPTRTGKIGIGPASIRLVNTLVVMEGTLRRIAQEVNISVPRLELESIELPDGAPDGFENAIGNFTLAVSSTATSVQEGDPIPVDIKVSGYGNLDTLRPPKPVDSSGWKLYDVATDQRGDERREITGTTDFHQFMRPLELKPSVPSFRLVFFDPKEKAYKTLTSPPIPLQMTPAAPPKADTSTPPQALAVPVERMTDILGLLAPSRLVLPDPSKLPNWIAHAIAALLALTLISKALWMRHGHRFHKDKARAARLNALREIEQATGGDAGFLMAAGRYIERWLGENQSPEVHEILTTRDHLCFQQEKSAQPMLDPKRRSAILRTLRKAAMALAFLCFFTPQNARSQDSPNLAREAYESARFDEAIAHWFKAGPYQNLSPDVLYNIGNACYRAGSPGHAALYYRRALARDPGHQEARQNLRFIERKYGSITVHRPEYQYAIARIPLAAWKAILWSGAWLCALAILVFPATRPGARLRISAVAALVAAPLLAACGGLGWRYFPNDAEFAPVERQAVIIREKAVLHTDASRTSPEVIDAPPGSLCEIIHQSGRWAFVSFASKTRGWIPIEAIENVIPNGKPAPPQIRKPIADSKSA